MKITVNGKITNTALLLLGKPEAAHLLSPYVAEITWKLDTEVTLEIYGHAIGENYSKLLIERNDELTLTEVALLDKVQKKQPINDDAAFSMS
jgi:hypothetical protein